MDALGFFLREHAAVHTKAVAPADVNVDWLLDGLSEAQWRARPAGFNSLAWLLWHLARVEDACVSVVVAGEPQFLDETWCGRLVVSRRDTGEGMQKDEVAALSEAIDLEALRRYRDAVGRRTREHAAALWPDRWDDRLGQDDLRRAAGAGVLAGDEHHLVGKPREALLFWWGLHHSVYHLGQAAMVRGAVSPPASA